MSTNSSHRPRGFESTSWSLVAQVRSGDPEVRQQALERLLSVYYPALKAHLELRMRLRPYQAEDLLQNFVLRKMLERDLIGRADQSKGRLRCLLLKSLENFARTELGRASKHARQQSLDGEIAPPAKQADADVFDVAWARSVLIEALCRMSAECKQLGRHHIWALFEARVVGPAMGRSTVPYEDLVERLRLVSPQVASNALITAKRQFNRALRTVIAESVETDEEIEQELGELRAILAGTNSRGSFALPPDLLPNSDTPTMIVAAIDESDPRALAELLDVQVNRESLWEESDLRALLKHQLQVPLNLVFAKMGQGAGRSTIVLPSFGGLLASRHPSLEVLNEVKTASRQAVHDETSAIPVQIAATLYFASIALARVRLGESITKLPPNAQRYGYRKMLAQAWLGKRLTHLFREALELAGDAPDDHDEGV